MVVGDMYVAHPPELVAVVAVESGLLFIAVLLEVGLADDVGLLFANSSADGNLPSSAADTSEKKRSLVPAGSSFGASARLIFRMTCCP